MKTAKDRMLDELRIAHVRWQIAPAWADRIGSGATTVETLLRDCQLHIVKHGSHRTVYRIDRPEQSFYLKRYRSGGVVALLRRLLRASNSWREYRKALELERRGVPSVLPVAVGQTSSRVTSGDDFLLTAAIANAMSLEDLRRAALADDSRAETIDAATTIDRRVGRDDGRGASRGRISR